jgi:hypothetical protein
MQKKSPEERIAYGNAGFQYYNSTFSRKKIISDIETIMFD